MCVQFCSIHFCQRYDNLASSHITVDQPTLDCQTISIPPLPFRTYLVPPPCMHRVCIGAYQRHQSQKAVNDVKRSVVMDGVGLSVESLLTLSPCLRHQNQRHQSQKAVPPKGVKRSVVMDGVGLSVESLLTLSPCSRHQNQRHQSHKAVKGVKRSVVMDGVGINVESLLTVEGLLTVESLLHP